jgi:hypothetical protein
VLTASVARWAAWAPGLATPDQWDRWCREPGPVGVEGSPPVSFLPPLLRRRCSRLSRMALETAFGCGSRDELAGVTTVFASRHGDSATSIALLQSVARGEPLSPTRFSHSVHNAPAGLFCIATGNRLPSTSLAAARGTFGSGFLEAMLMLRRGDGRPVLLVTADEPVPPPFTAFRDEPLAAYALALLLLPGGDVAFRPAGGGDRVRSREWPPALEFLRWLRLGGPAVTLGAEAGPWTWSRTR